MSKKISSLDYKLRQILSDHGDKDLTEGFSPRSLVEENQAANERLREQLSSFKNSDGTPIDLKMVDQMTGHKMP